MRPLSALALVVLPSVLLGVSTPAKAAEDTTKPTLNVASSASPLLGSQLGAEYHDGWNLLTEVDLVASWRGEDDSGICGYRIAWRNTEEFFGWTRWGYDTVVAETRYANGRDQYSPWGYDIQVRDCAGNKRKRFVSFDPTMWQEDAATYSGGWGTSTCACWSGGTTRRTSEPGARADFTSDSWHHGAGTFANVGVVMETAPDRGKAQILIDGELAAVVDTYSATRKHRSIVWVGQVPGGSPHTISVVNLATPGRARIDVDALVIS